jgi:hypothetical protein
LVGTVFDTAGNPVAGALVAATQVTGPLPTTGPRSDANGRYELDAVPGTYGFLAVLSGYTQLVVPRATVSLTSTSGPDLTLSANNATLSGVVRDAGAGLSVGGAFVVLADAHNYDVVEVAAEADGAYALHAAAGTYGFGVLQNGGGYSFRYRFFDGVVLDVGAATRDVALPTLTKTGATCITAPCTMSLSGVGYVANGVVNLNLYPAPGTTSGVDLSTTTVADAHGKIALAWSFTAQPGTYQLYATQADAHGSLALAPSPAYTVQAPVAKPIVVTGTRDR